MNPGDKALCDPAPQEARHVDGAGGGEKAWTAGPWEVEDFDPTRVQCSARGEQICDTAYATEKSPKEIFANAHLIAASPALAEAIEPFAALAKRINPDLPDSTELAVSINGGEVYRYFLGTFRDARAALAKAEGRS